MLAFTSSFDRHSLQLQYKMDFKNTNIYIQNGWINDFESKPHHGCKILICQKKFEDSIFVFGYLTKKLKVRWDV